MSSASDATEQIIMVSFDRMKSVLLDGQRLGDHQVPSAVHADG